MTPEAIAMWPLLKDTAASWSDHKAARLGAALAYYSIFSLGPLIVIAVAVAGLTFGQDAARGEVSAQLQDLLGPTGAQAVNAMLLGASKPTDGILATVLGVGTLVFAALGLESTYGAAASLVVLLIWVYYSSQLVLMGAEFTRVYAMRRALGNISASGDRPPVAAPGVDHYVHVAAGRSAYAAAIMAFLVGWLFGRLRDRNQYAGRTRAI